MVMKKLLILLLMLPLLSRAQAHLGMTEYEIKSEHPTITFTTYYTDKGVKYISGNMAYGEFLYYFDDKGVTDFNIQIPYKMNDVNALTEIYNKKYVITSDHTWKAYVGEGGIIYIIMLYSEETKLWCFTYEM